MISDFEYHAPKTLKEALELLDKYKDDYKIICGGQSLLVVMRQGLVKPAHVIDIKKIKELNYIKYDAKKGLKIGATTTHRTIEKSPIIQKSYAVLSEMEHRLASVQTRNWGSIGGNLCHADPAGDPAPVLMVLNASLILSSINGERVIPIDEFFIDYFETVMEHGEMLTEIQLPVVPANTGVAYSKFNIIETDMATVGVAVSITLASDTCKDIRIALGAAAPTAIRAKKAENYLRGKKITENMLKEAGEIASTEADPISDINASSDYRRELVKVLVKRITREAMNKAK